MSSSDRKSRFSTQGLIGAGLIVTGLIVLAGLAATPLLWQQALQPDIEEGRRMLALIEQKIGDAEKNRKPMAVTEANAPQAFVEGSTAGLATASLQRIMVDRAKDNGMQVAKVQPLPAEDNNGLARLRLDMEITGSLESLQSYLLAIEAGAPLIFVREIHIATPSNTEGADPQYPSDSLTVSLQVEAFSWWGVPS